MSDHTHLVIEGLADIQAAANDAEAGGRGFLLTDDAAFLERYRAAVSDAPAMSS